MEKEENRWTFEIINYASNHFIYKNFLKIIKTLLNFF